MVGAAGCVFIGPAGFITTPYGLRCVLVLDLDRVLTRDSFKGVHNELHSINSRTIVNCLWDACLVNSLVPRPKHEKLQKRAR